MRVLKITSQFTILRKLLRLTLFNDLFYFLFVPLYHFLANEQITHKRHLKTALYMKYLIH